MDNYETMLTVEKRITRRKPWVSGTFPTTNPKRTGLMSNPSLRGERLTCNGNLYDQYTENNILKEVGWIFKTNINVE
jgi:hypothetical protein